MRTLRLPLFLAALSCTSAIRADDARWPIERSASPITTPYQWNKDALRAVPAEFLNDATACYLYSGTTHNLEPDGTVAMTVHEVIRLNTARAVDEFGEYRSIAFAPAYERVALHWARVHKSNGEQEDILPRHVHVRDVNTDHLVYDSSKQVLLSFPRLQPGDVMEVSWTVRGKHPEYREHFFHRYSFGDEKYPVACDEWTVRLPKSRELKHATIHGDVPFAVRELGDQRVYSWKLTNLPAPRIGERKPGDEETRLQAACSTFPSWQAVFEWERALLAGRCDCPPDAKRLVASLTRNLADDEAKARVLTRFVRQNIRYLSRGDKHDYTPHAPRDVLHDRCGDCKDSAHLLAVLMREAGLKADVATLGPRGDGQVLESMPCPWGTHALTVVTIQGRDFWIDTTARRIGWNVVPYDDSDRVCYVSDPNGFRLTRTPKSLPEHRRTESTMKLKVASNGDAVGERVQSYSGIAAWLKREELADKSKSEQRHSIAADLLELMPNGKLTKWTIDSMNDTDVPLVVRAEFTAPELFSGDGSLEAKLGDTTFLSELLAAAVNPERESALEIGDPAEFVCRFEIELPPIFRFAPGMESERAKSRWCECDVRIQHRADQPRKLLIDSHAIITASRVEAAELAEWRDFLDALQATFRVPVQIRPTREPADIPLLADACIKSPDDAHSAIALAELYLSEQRMNEARRLLETARAASPHERKLWDLSLVAADRIEDQERIYRSMLARFADDAQIAVELAQNLIDQDRPGEAQKILQPLTNHKQSSIRAAAYIELAHCSMSQDEPRKALRHLAKAQEIDSNSLTPDAWFLKGQIHESLNEPKSALNAYLRSLDSDEAADALEAATRMALALDRKTDALDYWRRLAVTAEGDAEFLARTAELAIRLGRVDDALDLAGRASIGKDELHPLAHRPLGLAYWQRGQFEEAIQHLSMAEIDADVLVALVQSQIALGRLFDAEKQLARFSVIEPTKESRQTVDWIKALSKRRLEIAPKIIAAGVSDANQMPSVDCSICAEALDSRGLWPNQVQRLLTEAFRHKDPPAAAFGLRAGLRLRRGELTAALRDADQALMLNPNEPKGLQVRGRVRLERGDKGGLADLEQAAVLTSRKNAGILHDLAWGYAAVNRFAEALAAQREAMTLKPDDPTIREQLAELESISKAQQKAPVHPGR